MEYPSPTNFIKTAKSLRSTLQFPLKVNGGWGYDSKPLTLFSVLVPLSNESDERRL